MIKGKRYTEEFKNEAVKQITERGYTVTEIVDRLGVCTKTLYQWCSDLRVSPKEIKSTDDQAEIADLNLN
jgi:transposase